MSLLMIVWGLIGFFVILPLFKPTETLESNRLQLVIMIVLAGPFVWMVLAYSVVYQLMTGEDLFGRDQYRNDEK